VTGATSTRLPGGPAEPGARRPARVGALRPLSLVILVATLAALALRAAPLLNPHVLLGVTEYDDGVYFGSAVRLVHGVLPYRDFILVQPPGIVLLMSPAALLSKVVGTAWGMATGRIMTVLASTLSVTLAGLLIRHRGVLATTIACAVMVVYPSSLVDSHSVLLEPWLVLFCLLAAVAAFDGDRLTSRPGRLALAGLSAGFAGAVEAWAIIPVVVIGVIALCQRTPPGAQPAGEPGRLRRVVTFAAGVVAGFGLPVAPFAVLGPRRFYDCIVSSQFNRVLPQSTPVWFRLWWMTGIGKELKLGNAADLAVAVGVVVLVCAAVALGWILARSAPAPLDWFALGTTALVIIAFLWYQLFFLHYPAFLAPFLGMSLGLPVSRLAHAVAGRRRGVRQRAALSAGGGPAAGSAIATPGSAPPVSGSASAGAPRPAGRVPAAIAAIALLACAASQLSFVTTIRPVVSPAGVAAARRLIPAGACVVTDQASYLIAADRFTSTRPGCSQLVDPLGVGYALGHGREGDTGSGKVAAVAAVFRAAFGHADYAWLTSSYDARRISWTPALRAYFRRNFVLLYRDGSRDALYVRRGVRP
jgi:hypothetical protein